MYPLPIPQPLMTDLDGDGKSEVVMVSDDRMTVRVLSIPHALAETLVSHSPFGFKFFRCFALPPTVVCFVVGDTGFVLGFLLY